MPRPRPANHEHVPVPVPPPPGAALPTGRGGAEEPRGPKGETYVRCRICGKRYWTRLEEAKAAEPESEPVSEPAAKARAKPRATRKRAAPGSN